MNTPLSRAFRSCSWMMSARPWEFAEASLARALGRLEPDRRAPNLHLESLGLSEEQKDGIAALSRRHEEGGVNPVVAYLVERQMA